MDAQIYDGNHRKIDKERGQGIEREIAERENDCEYTIGNMLHRHGADTAEQGAVQTCPHTKTGTRKPEQKKDDVFDDIIEHQRPG